MSGMEYYNWINCSKVIKAEVNTLQTEFSRLPDLHLSGIYLHGSLALGGFQPTRSDIDMIVTISERIEVESKRAAIELLLRISKFPSPIDVHFLVEQDITPFQQPLPFTLRYQERLREDYEQDLRTGAWQRWNEHMQYDPYLAIYLTVLYRKGICLFGKSVEEVFPRIPERIFRDALVADFQELQTHQLENIVALVLNACRTYAYLRDDTLLSKGQGGNWGLAHLPELYHPLIQQSLALYQGERLGRPVSRSLLDNFTVYMEEVIIRQQAIQA